MTGTSGTKSKVLRIPPFTESTPSDQVGVDFASPEGSHQVGKRVAGGAQVDRAA